jgi:ADP-ribose pyrophosphatase YjhB (NUDIX family)
MADFEKAGLLTLRDNRVLLCRKKHTTSLLILPGGVKEPNESAEQCLLRELAEELTDCTPGPLTYLATYLAPAAVPDKTVQIELYSATLAGTPQPASEIKELVWFGSGDDPALLAPSLRELIFPDMIHRGVLPAAILPNAIQSFRCL